ncbi:hypothetical protein MMPV_001476 [Pyropia vietnamensis]
MEARFAAALASRRARGLLRTIDDGVAAATGGGGDGDGIDGDGDGDGDGGGGGGGGGGGTAGCAAGGSRRRRWQGSTPLLVDFASNDYLGLATSVELTTATAAVLAKASAPGNDGDSGGGGGSVGGGGGSGGSGDSSGNNGGGVVPDRDRRVYGSGGSRLLTGGSPLHRRVETTAAAAHGWPDALYVGSGYAANVALFSCVLGDADAVLYDEAVHASVHDGLRLSRAARSRRGIDGGSDGDGVRRLWPFPHNSIPGLLRVATAALAAGAVAPGGTLLVAVESIYSMDGDAAPLGDLLDALSALGGAHPSTPLRLVVDEAHGVGVVHPRGALAAAGLSRHPVLLAAVVPYGKAHGASGAVILVASSLVRSYLVNYARPLIYSTAPPPAAAAAILASYPLVSADRVDALRALAAAFGSSAAAAGVRVVGGDGCVFGVPIPGGGGMVTAAADRVRAAGYDVRAIRPPTVPRGGERLRVVVHAGNTRAEVAGLVAVLADVVGGKGERRGGRGRGPSPKL